MEILTYILAAIVAYLGLAAGICVGWLSQEELKPGRKYINAVQDVLLSLVVLSLVYYTWNLIGAIIAAVIIFIILFFFKRRIRSWIIYSVLGALFFLSATNDTMFAVNASLMFLYGIPAGSLTFTKRGWYKPLIYNLGFLILALVLPAII